MTPLQIARKKVCAYALIGVLMLGVAAPALAQEQTTGGGTTANTSTGLMGTIRSFFGGGTTNPSQTGENSSSGSIVTSLTNGFTNFYNNPLETVGNMLQGGFNTIGNAATGISNWLEDPVANTASGLNNLMENVTNTFGGQNSGTNAIGGEGPVDLTPPGSGNSSTAEGSEEPSGSDSSGGGNAAGSTGQSGGGYRGAVGTVGNPFSTGDSDTTGANSDDIGTNNVETQTNPFLFEYDPSSTNNNPSGAEAMDN